MSSNDKNYLFSIDVTYYERKFKGQTSGGTIKTENISGDSVQDFLDRIYETSKDVALREIVFNTIEGTRKVEWSAKQRPEQSDMQNYILFQDKSKAKKNYKWNEINANLLTKWRGNTIGVLIHVHSLSVECSSDFDFVNQQLLLPAKRDRSGAHSTEAVVELAQRLQNTHVYLEGDPIAWKIWANSILAGNACDQENMIRSLPTGYIGENFRLKSQGSIHVQTAQGQIQAAQNLNQGYSVNIREIRHTYNILLDQVKALGMQIENLEARNLMESQLITAVQSAVSPHDNSDSQIFESQVSDHVDIDH